MDNDSGVQETVEKAMAASARSWALPVRAAYTSGVLRAAKARATAMIWAYEQGFTLQEVAGALDMDHSTLVYHKKQHASRLEEEGRYYTAWSMMKVLLEDY
jgi:hypothetical protein